MLGTFSGLGTPIAFLTRPIRSGNDWKLLTIASAETNPELLGTLQVLGTLTIVSLLPEELFLMRGDKNEELTLLNAW